MDLTQTRDRPKVQGWLAVAGLLVMVAAVYGPVVGHGFLWWDDNNTIHHNRNFSPPTGKGIAEYWVTPAGGLYAPVTYGMWGGLAFLAEMPRTDDEGIHLDARVYHAASLVLHLLSALLVYRILFLLSGHILPSFFGAALFALHPVQVEAVAWISGGKDLLFAMLSLCAIHQYLMYALTKRAVAGGETQTAQAELRAPGASGRPWVAYASGLVMLVLAMLSKPTAVVVPVIVAALDLFVVRRHWKAVAKAVAPWFIVALPFAIVARIVQVTLDIDPVAWWHRPFVATDAIAFYLGKLLWPVNLAPDYARKPQAVIEMFGGMWKYVIWLVPGAVAYFVWRGRKERPWVVAGALVFLAVLTPVLGFTPFIFQYTSTVADHYLYLAMLGPALILTWVLTRYASTSTSADAAAAVDATAAAVPQNIEAPLRAVVLRVGCGVALASFAVLSFLQLGVWRDDQTLWAHNESIAPRSFIAPNNLAAAYGRRATTIGQAALAVRDKGDKAEAQRLLDERRALLKEAIAALERAVDANPDYLNAYRNAYVNCMRVGDLPRAAYHMEHMLRLGEKAPDVVKAEFAKQRLTLARLYLRLGCNEKAAWHYEEVLKQQPGDAQAKFYLDEARKRMAEARIE